MGIGRIAGARDAPLGAKLNPAQRQIPAETKRTWPAATAVGEGNLRRHVFSSGWHTNRDFCAQRPGEEIRLGSLRQTSEGRRAFAPMIALDGRSVGETRRGNDCEKTDSKGHRSKGSTKRYHWPTSATGATDMSSDGVVSLSGSGSPESIGGGACSGSA